MSVPFVAKSVKLQLICCYNAPSLEKYGSTCLPHSIWLSSHQQVMHTSVIGGQPLDGGAES
jgi:hypothetical protein